MSLTKLPLDILHLIADYFTDPCDLLDLRLVHPAFNFLAHRFSTKFPPTTYMCNNSPRSLDSMLFWVAQHDYPRLLRKILTPGAWPDNPYPGTQAFRQASMNAARHGNLDAMSTIIDYADDSSNYAVDLSGVCMLSGGCMEIAIFEDQLDVQKALVDRGIGPAWQNSNLHSVMVQAMKAHRPELLEYMLSDAVRATWSLADDGEVQNALPRYTVLLGRGQVPTWCQRILYLFLQREDLSRIDPPELMFHCIRNMPRRNCGPECDVWFVRNRKLDKGDMLMEIKLLQNQGYAHLMDIE